MPVHSGHSSEASELTPDPALAPAPVGQAFDSAPFSTVPGDAERARRALDHAVARAEHRPTHDFAEPTRAEDLALLPRTELRALLDRVLLGKRPEAGFLSLLDSGVLAAELPEIAALVGFGEGGDQHKDVWRHTIQVVAQAVARPAVRWAALFHDVGKPRTKSIARDGTVHFYHHAEVGARMFVKFARRSGLFEGDDELVERVRFLVFHHQRAHQYDEHWTDSAVRRFALEVGDALDDLMAVSRADMTTKYRHKRQRFMHQLKRLQNRIECIQAEDSKPKALPKGLGSALISELNLPASKLIGDIRKQLEAAVCSGELQAQADCSVYVEFVRTNPERFNLP